MSHEVIVRQCNRLIHRGPDEAGYLIDGDFGFGMRRLSIIDLVNGHQPIASQDGRFSVICNGEIVNHLELRRGLADFPFRTRSDIETLLASYLRWGDEAWLRFEGMYAAAIWDHHSKTLTLARDPLGIKPLYVTEQAGGIGFASEITAVRELPGLEFDIDERSVHDFFQFGHVLGPRSIFRQINSLQPGHVLRVGPLGSSTTTAFWKPRVQVLKGLSDREWVDETRRRILRTVGQHMLSDVPVGAFLSGGVDSGAVVAAMARTSGTNFSVFTAGFPGSKIDETAAAQQVADHIGCKHFVLPLRPETAADVLPAVQRAFDEPTAANSAIPLWYLSRSAAQHVEVVLCGEGGDELFRGYNRQRWARRMHRAAPFVRSLGGLQFIDGIPQFPQRKLNYLREYLQRFRDGAMLHNGFERFFAAVTITNPTVRASIYDRGFWSRNEVPNGLSALAEEYFPDAGNTLTHLEQFELGDLTVHMPASLLQRLDRASMAHSLEARVPFLSHSFVDWALTVPANLKFRNGVGKYVLRRAVQPWLPKGALNRPKLGFQMPLADWFVGGFNDFARDTWNSSGAADAGYLDRNGVEQLFEDHRAGRANHGRILYAIAMFSCWWKEQRYLTANEPVEKQTRAKV